MAYKNKKKQKEQGRRYCQANKKKIAKQKKKYRQSHKSEIDEYGRKYYQNNKGKIVESRKKHYQDNKEKIIERRKKYYQANKGKILDYGKQYDQSNKGKIRLRHQTPGGKLKISIKNAKRRSLKLKNTTTNITSGELNKRFTFWGNSCVYCGATDKKLTMDHIIALSDGGPHSIENIIPACSSCNSSKGAKPIQEWNWDVAIRITRILFKLSMENRPKSDTELIQGELAI